MSFPSVTGILASRNVTPQTASEIQLHNAVIEALKTDLSAGFSVVESMVEDLTKTSEKRVVMNLDPNSRSGKQFIRLFASDVVRAVLEKHFHVALGFYNCCKGVVAHRREELQLSLCEQVENQNQDSVDC